jgi:hypothetical protein
MLLEFPRSKLSLDLALPAILPRICPPLPASAFHLQFSSVQFSSVQFSSVQFSSVHQVQFSSTVSPPSPTSTSFSISISISMCHPRAGVGVLVLAWESDAIHDDYPWPPMQTNLHICESANLQPGRASARPRPHAHISCFWLAPCTLTSVSLLKMGPLSSCCPSPAMIADIISDPVCWDRQAQSGTSTCLELTTNEAHQELQTLIQHSTDLLAYPKLQ